VRSALRRTAFICPTSRSPPLQRSPNRAGSTPTPHVPARSRNPQIEFRKEMSPNEPAPPAELVGDPPHGKRDSGTAAARPALDAIKRRTPPARSMIAPWGRVNPLARELRNSCRAFALANRSRSGPGSELAPRVEQDRDRPAVHERDVHRRLEAPRHHG